MKISEMLQIKQGRRNLIGFLHISEQLLLNELFNNFYDVNKKSFNDICDKAIELYTSKALSNKIVTNIFNILMTSNESVRTESHRLDNHSLYKYDSEQNAYIFVKKSTTKEFNSLVHFID